MSKFRFAAIVAVALVSLIATRAQAAISFSDTFEGYADQAAFEAAWPAFVSTSTTMTTGVFVTTGGGAGGSTKWVQQPAQAANNQNRNMRNVGESATVSATNLVAFSFDFFDSNAAAAPQRNHSNVHDGGVSPVGSGQLVSMGLNNNLSSTADGGNFYMGRILGYKPPEAGTVTSTGQFFKLNGAGAPLRSTGWHNLRVVVDNSSFRFYVDGVLSRTVANSFTLRSYETLVLGSGLSNGSVQAGVDNVKLISDTAMAVVATGPAPGDGATDVGTINGSTIDALLDWDTQTNDEWNLFLWKTGDPIPTAPVASDLTASQFAATGLEGSTNYSWRVDSFNAFDDRAAGNVWSFTTTAVPEPAGAGLLLLATAAMLKRRRAA